jgi:hypothetical protein
MDRITIIVRGCLKNVDLTPPTPLKSGSRWSGSPTIKARQDRGSKSQSPPIGTLFSGGNLTDQRIRFLREI